MKDVLVLGTERWSFPWLPFLPAAALHNDTRSFFDWSNHAAGSCRWLQSSAVVIDGTLCVTTTTTTTTAMILVVALLLLLLLLLLLMLWLCYKRYRAYRMLAVNAKLPTVFWRPKFANLHLHKFHNQEDAFELKKLSDATITNMLPRMQRLNGPYGLYGTLYGWSTPVVHVAHGVPAAAILQNTTTKAPAYDHFFNFCGQGVFTADGPDWKAKRTAVLHALLRGSSNHHHPPPQHDITALAERAADEIVARLLRLVANNASCCSSSSSPPPPDVVPILQTATVQLIYRFITRTELCLENENAKTSRNNNNHDNNLHSLHRYLESITRIRLIILAQSRSIWFVLPRWCYRTFSSLYRSEETTMQPIRRLARQACQAAAPGSPLDALQHLPLYRDSPTNALDEAITLLFAGQDTSAATLSWTLYLLSRHPHVQQRLADELLPCSSSSSSSINDVIDKKQQQQQRSMVYLDAVVKESMRLYPVAPFVLRQLEQDVIIPDGPVLPAGVMACIWIYSLHRNPNHWEEPDQFRPERWLSNAAAAAKTTTTATPSTFYMPFAAGPRNCVGQPLANVVVRTILARLVGEFDVQDEVDAGHKRMQAGFTVLPQGGLKLRFVPRRRSMTTTTNLSSSS